MKPLRIVLLLGVVVAVVLAAFVVRIVRESREYSRQHRTQADIRIISAALEAYATAVNSYPRVLTVQELQPYLVPKYIPRLPVVDGWRRPLRYEWQGPSAAPDGYALGSAARDGLWERPHLRDYKHVAVPGFDADIVFMNGDWLQFPDTGPHPQ
jgi:type II secretory pathway pseudopilin PulG